MRNKMLALGLASQLLGCATGSSRNGMGFFYTEVTDSIVATTNSNTPKMGTSCATNILSLVSTGDMSIETGKKNGGITKVASVDYTTHSVLGFYEKTCVVVRGE